MRPDLKHPTQNQDSAPILWKVSSGTAVVLGLAAAKLDAAPTTAYLMLGERCLGNCAFCAQARGSLAKPNALSRVLWPTFDSKLVAERIGRAHTRGDIQRVCFQVTVSPGYLEETVQAVRAAAQASETPICASVAARDLEQIQLLLDAGAERVTLALDAASPEVHQRVKSGSWSATRDLLQQAARAFPGRIGTHLIVGLGETEREMVDRIQELHDRSVSIAMFSFTPVRGTPLQDQPAPALAHYRRIQAARWLIVHELTRANRFDYDSDGRLISLGQSRDQLAQALADGEAFRTSGCPGCNRPYYNERPGGVIYNYPQPLTTEQAASELRLLLDNLNP